MRALLDLWRRQIGKRATASQTPKSHETDSSAGYTTKISAKFHGSKKAHNQNHNTFLRGILRVFVRRQDIKPLQRPDVVQQHSPHPSHNEPKHITKNDTVTNQSSAIKSPVDAQGGSPSNAESRIVTQADDPAPSLIDDSHPSELADLTGQIGKTSLYPVFEGVYSNIFTGEWEASKVAIKVVRGVGTLYATRRRLTREKQVWGTLRHHHILPLYGYCEGLGEFGAFISPWYQNGDIGRYIRQHSVSALQRFEWLCEIIEGVAYLHAHEPVVIHGDLKPLNVLIDDEGHARICDFGLVRCSFIEHTTTSHVGTLRYRARELVNTAERDNADEQGVITTASDIYAVGCIGLELLFLRLPYAEYGAGEHVLMAMAIHKGIPPIKGIPVAGTPPLPIKQLWKVLKSCWNKDPRSRPSASQLQEYMSVHRSAIIASLEEDFASTSFSPV